MHLVRYLSTGGTSPCVGVQSGDVIQPLPIPSMGALLALPQGEIRDLAGAARGAPAGADPMLLPPVDGRMEVWAAGVTYRRSREARMEESASAHVYDLVYEADRPELFFKSVAWRTVTNGEPIGLRRDSELNVPEAELAVVVNAAAEIVGYAVCNDVSSRSIEGENPLYLPQAKIYAGACALSAGIRPAWEVQSADRLTITLTIERDSRVVWCGDTSTSQMRRTPRELVDYLFRGMEFPEGVIVTTGTGIVPEMSFTLHDGDLVTVTIDEVGVLTNRVLIGRDRFAWLAASNRHEITAAPQGAGPDVTPTVPGRTALAPGSLTAARGSRQ